MPSEAYDVRIHRSTFRSIHMHCVCSTSNEQSTINDSSFQQNCSSHLTMNNVTQPVDVHSVTVCVLCRPGLPANLLVIAVYIVKMTTSTRVYMFSLAVADSTVCICGLYGN